MLTVLAVVAGMTIPQFAGAIGSARLKEYASDLLIAARHARDCAITHRCDCRLVIDAAAGSYRLEMADPNSEAEGGYVPLPLVWGRPQSLGTKVRFDRVTIQPADGGEANGCIVFRPSGLTDAAIVEVTDGQRAYSLLLVPPAGRAELVTGRINGLPDDREDLDARD